MISLAAGGHGKTNRAPRFHSHFPVSFSPVGMEKLIASRFPSNRVPVSVPVGMEMEKLIAPPFPSRVPVSVPSQVKGWMAPKTFSELFSRGGLLALEILVRWLVLRQ